MIGTLNGSCNRNYNKSRKNIQWGKYSLCNILCWVNWTITCKRMKLDYYFTLCTKVNSRWIKYLNIRPQTMKLLEENICGKILDIGLGGVFFVLFFCFFFGSDSKGKGNKKKWTCKTTSNWKVSAQGGKPLTKGKGSLLSERR